MKQIETEAISDKPNPQPIKDGILIQRIAGEVWTNVPHAVVQHSPTGYEFGYEGSGPADLALNILEAVLVAAGYKGRRTACLAGSCFDLAYRLHQEFKRAYVATLDQDKGGTIAFQAVKNFIRSHEKETRPALSRAEYDGDE